MDKSIDKNSATLSNNFVVILATAILKLPPTFIQTYRQERQHDDGDDGDGDSGHQSGIVLHHSRLDDGSVSSVPHGRYLVYEKREKKQRQKKIIKWFLLHSGPGGAAICCFVRMVRG